MRILLGCRKIILFGVFGCIVVFALSLFGSNRSANDGLPTLAALPSLTWTPETVAEVATEPPGVTIIPTVVRASSGFVTITPAQGTVYPTPTITDTPLPTATNTDLPTATIAPTSIPTAAIKVINGLTYYATRTANVRSCASSTCEKLGQVTSGTSVTVMGIVEGEAVTGSNSTWYQVQYGGTLGFIYGAYLTDVAPVKAQPPVVVQEQPVQQQPAAQQPAPSGYSGPIPKNCTEARAMGIDQYTAAQINPKLDRDKDGKACYDDQ